MAATPEIPRGEPQVTEIDNNAEFVVDETLKNTGVQVVQKNFTTQIKSSSGKPIIQTPPTQVITVQPPADPAALTVMAKGSVSSSSTWLAAFWLRIIKKAMHFGWRIMGANNDKPTSN